MRWSSQGLATPKFSSPILGLIFEKDIRIVKEEEKHLVARRGMDTLAAHKAPGTSPKRPGM